MSRILSISLQRSYFLFLIVSDLLTQEMTRPFSAMPTTMTRISGALTSGGVAASE
jgi:hypothetical protein